MNSDPKTERDQPAKTHIHLMMEKIAQSPYSVAPEKKDALRKILQEKSIHLSVKDDESAEFVFDTIFGRISTSIHSLKHCWISACFLSSLYCEKLKAEERGETEIPISYNENIERVRIMYEESCKTLKGENGLPFPPDVRLLTPAQDYLILADEIFLSMCSFILLHEIAHTKCEHTRVNDSMGAQSVPKSPYEMEMEADKWAYDWILSAWKEYGDDPKIFTKRTLGIIFTLTMTDEFRFLFQESTSTTHPPAIDRVIQFYNNYKNEIENNEWKGTCFSAISLGFQMVAINNKKPIPQGPYDGIGDFLCKLKEAQTL